MVEKLLHLCEGLVLLCVDLIPKSRKPFSTQGSLSGAGISHSMYHPLVAENEGGKERRGTLFSLEVTSKTSILLKSWSLTSFKLNFSSPFSGWLVSYSPGCSKSPSLSKFELPNLLAPAPKCWLELQDYITKPSYFPFL